MLSLILGLFILIAGVLIGLIFIGVGLFLIFGKMCNNPLATFILGIITDHWLFKN